MAEQRRADTRAVAVWTLAGLAGVLLIAFALVVGPWLFTRHLQPELTAEQQLKAMNDVRTTLVQALAGLAVAGGLIVTYRTYRQNQVEQDRTYEQRQTEQDRIHERELYAKAVEQLGHGQAPVRLGALYSLESLAQDRPQRRQTVVDVLCAYLRMPYAPPSLPDPGAEQEPSQRSTGVLPSAHDPAQELQVRQTAQRLLAKHLRRPPDTSGEDAQRRPPSPDETFWPDITLDLTGATLVEFNLLEASILYPNFTKATFTGAVFDNATFIGHTSFQEATFTDGARFDKATFAGRALFVFATFNVYAGFRGATFTDGAYFEMTTFTGGALFGGATFTGPADFIGATFTDRATFDAATFTAAAWFLDATFTGPADFIGATFPHDASLEAKVLHLDDAPLNERRSWPSGWTVLPDSDDPRQGKLVKA